MRWLSSVGVGVVAVVGLILTADVGVAEDGANGTCEVTSSADSGTGTLRNCLLSVQNGDVITFNVSVFPPGNPTTIILSSDLPALTSGNVFIDAFGSGVVLDGSGTTGNNGLTILSDGNRIYGLEISGFPMHGIYIDGSDNEIGGAPIDGIDHWNIVTDCDTGIGISGNGSANNYIITNVIGGCRIGISIAPLDPPVEPQHVLDNLIGVDLDGIRNDNDMGIVVASGQGHRIVINRIQFNDIGIRVESDATPESTQNCVSGNTIGVSHAGSAINLNFSFNWWNATDGPSGEGPGNGDSIEYIGTGTVDYDPWLRDPCWDIRFIDGFESGDTSRWSGVGP